MSEEITYRLATPGDIDALVAMRCDFLREAVPEAPLDEPVIQNMRAYFRDSLPAGSFIAHLALSGQRIVATSGLVIHAHPPTRRNPTGKLAYVMNMYTLPDFRRRGIATRLLEQLIESARRAQSGRVCLHALAGSRSLYEKCGFSAVKSEMRFEIR